MVQYDIAFAPYVYITTKPNKTVKGTRRPLTVLKFGLLIGFGGFAVLPLAARPLPLR